jgi:NAD(P)H-flavin reductase
MAVAVAYDPMAPRPYRVRRVHRDTADTFTLELSPVNRDEKTMFKPGQFNMLYVHGAGEIPVSISGNPATHTVLTHTVRVVGAVTEVMRRLKRGDTLGVRGPFGTWWPVEQMRGRDVILMAGGIGLAPLRPALLEILHHRAAYGKVVVLYGTRTPKDILYRRELEQIRGRFDTQVLVTVDRAAEGWHGHVGVVTSLVPRAVFDPERAAAFLCGPEVMMHYAIDALSGRGVTAEQMYVSMERNMKCGIGLCGHCQWGAHFICKDGPVFRYDRIAGLAAVREL